MVGIAIAIATGVIAYVHFAAQTATKPLIEGPAKTAPQ